MHAQILLTSFVVEPSSLKPCTPLSLLLYGCLLGDPPPAATSMSMLRRVGLHVWLHDANNHWAAKI
jgi:hypothetical protein